MNGRMEWGVYRVGFGGDFSCRNACAERISLSDAPGRIPGRDRKGQAAGVERFNAGPQPKNRLGMSAEGDD